MKLYFVRHAAAARKSSWTAEDGLRPLTRTGKKRFHTAAAALVSAGALAPDLIVTSPLVRARQTAQILAKTLPGSVKVVEDPRLGPSFDRRALHAILAENRSARSIAIVGHNPSFAEVLAEVTGTGSLNVRKGAIALVDLDSVAAPSGRLMWLTPPEIFSPCG